MTTRILCVADGGITPAMMSALKELESYDAEVTIVEDSQMTSMAEITDRMGVIERAGIDAAPTCPELLANCAEADVIVVHVASVNREVIDAAPNLKLVCVLRGGYENADVEYLKSKGIRLTNAPWRSANAVADFTVGMMIAENKNIARSHHFLKEGKWVKRYSNQPFIRDMRKCTVGLVGFGFIGSRVAKRLSGFECRVVVFDPYVDAKEIEAHGVDVADSLESLLEASDFVSLHMRISSDTHHMIDAEALRRMKPTAYLSTPPARTRRRGGAGGRPARPPDRGSGHRRVRRGAHRDGPPLPEPRQRHPRLASGGDLRRHDADVGGDRLRRPGGLLERRGADQSPCMKAAGGRARVQA